MNDFAMDGTEALDGRGYGMDGEGRRRVGAGWPDEFTAVPAGVSSVVAATAGLPVIGWLGAGEGLFDGRPVAETFSYSGWRLWGSGWRP